MPSGVCRGAKPHAVKVPTRASLLSRGSPGEERLTAELAEHFEEHVAPRGIGVVVVAEHTCMTLRGARAGGSRTVTTAVRGVLGENGQEREEFLASTRQLARSDRRQA